MSLPAGLYDILATTGDTNFVISYVLSETALTDPATAPPMATAVADDVTLNQGLTVVGPGIILRGSVTVQIDFDSCEAMAFMCFTVVNAPRASFTESVLTNNILCADFNIVKQCYPRKLSRVISRDRLYTCP